MEEVWIVFMYHLIIKAGVGRWGMYYQVINTNGLVKNMGTYSDEIGGMHLQGIRDVAWWRRAGNYLGGKGGPHCQGINNKGWRIIVDVYSGIGVAMHFWGRKA